MTSSREPESDGAEQVALVLDAGGARSAYQVGALEVLLPVLAERDQRPTLLIGTSAGALLSAALTGTAHLDAEEQAARLLDTLGRATKDNVMQPLWRQAPVVALRYVSETLGISRFRLRGLFGTAPLARTLAQAIDWSALHDNVERGVVTASVVSATTVRSGRVTMFTEATQPDMAMPEPPVEHHRQLRAHAARCRAPDGLLRHPRPVPVGARRGARPRRPAGTSTARPAEGSRSRLRSSWAPTGSWSSAPAASTRQRTSRTSTSPRSTSATAPPRCWGR